MSSHDLDPPDRGWSWVDVTLGENDDADALNSVGDHFQLDRVAVHDARGDPDLPKFDDFGHHLLVVLHGLRDDRIASYELDCFVSARVLVTVRRHDSASIDTLWDALQRSTDLAEGGVDELAARLADVLTRRLLSVVDAFDERLDGLIAQALAADDRLLSDLTAVRADLAAIRRVAHPQRETLDELRHTRSPLLSDAARRRFSDVFDVAARAVVDLDGARSALTETLEAYRGAEARRATDVTRMLTVYAAVLLPLSLVASFFGMNHQNLPTIGQDWGWVAVTAVMAVMASTSLGIFVATGWIRRPSGRATGATIGRGLIEAARTPAQLVGAVYEISVLPIRTVASRTRTPPRNNRPD
ncbi:MAG: magnesium transporter CorA family protein [Acidimicrobiia bacterium]|nr:magnesium transporter CorA family protein [Acidimicrobiia bacterium]